MLIETSQIIKANHLENGEFNRVDVVVRAMYADAKIKNIPEIEIYGCMYRRMQMKRRSAKIKRRRKMQENFNKLIDSFLSHGFSEKYKICLSKEQNLILRDGSHRLAISMALGLSVVPVQFKCKRCAICKGKRREAKPFGLGWFEKRGFTEKEMKLIRQGMKKFISC